MKIIVHTKPSGKIVLEGLAAERPIPKLPAGSFLIDSRAIPGKAEYLVWNSDTSKLEIDPAKKAAHDDKDRRSSLEKFVDEVIAQGLIPPGKKKDILG